jgi:hypothetical protein
MGIKRGHRTYTYSEVDHGKCPQAEYMNAQNSRTASNYSVPVENRFNVLGN